MSKRLFTFCVMVLFASTLILAQDKPLIKSKVLVDDSVVPTITTSGKMPTGVTLAGEPIGKTTNYDYFSNSVVRDQIVWDATLETPHLLNMVRPFDMAAPTVRYVLHSYKESGSWINNPVHPGQAGWPQIDVGLTGDGAGLVAGVFHSPSRYWIWDFGTTYTAVQFDASSDPSIQLAGNTAFLAASGNRLLFSFYKAVDFASPVLWDTISSFHPTIWYAGNGGVEVGMSKSQNEQNLLYFGTNEGIVGGGAHVYTGTPEAEADNFWVVSSTDAGASWTGEMIGPDGVLNIVSGYHTPQYAPLFENFGQVDMAVTNAGIKHAVANGYGLTFNAAGDTAIGNSFPVLYWNSTTDTWVSVSSQAIDTIQSIGDLYPTNSIGQAYPSVSVSENGQVVYVMWTGPQFTAGVMDTSGGFYWRDLYHAYSTDGGTTWTYGGVFPGMQANMSEVFGHASQHLQFIAPNTYRAHIVYLADLTTGVGPFDGILTDNPLIYDTYDITVSSVDGNGTLVNSFDLAQNYPNPFNPSTSISYTLAENTNVTLKVYDVLGKEVANLVNANQEAGTHKVTFDASKLSSGLYIYTLNAGSFTSSKKMMLLK